MGTTAVTTAGVVLAAGASRRMGSPKQLVDVGGQPLLARVVATACAAALDEVVVVLGANAAAVRDAVEWGCARVVVNERNDEGMSTSLQAGVAALDDAVERCVVLLGDQPLVTARLIDALLDAQRTSGRPGAALRHDGVLRPPVVLERTLWGEIAELRGDVGLRDVLRAHPEWVTAVDADDAEVLDVDTPGDVETLRHIERT